MKFDEAVEHVRKTKESLYTFIPRRKLVNGSSMIIGGGIYCIKWNTDRITDKNDEFYSEEESDIDVSYSGGIFGSSSGEEDFYNPDDPELDIINNLLFYPVKGKFEQGLMTEYCLLELEGFDTSILDTFTNNNQMIKYLNIQPFMTKFKNQ